MHSKDLLYGAIARLGTLGLCHFPIGREICRQTDSEYFLVYIFLEHVHRSHLLEHR